MQNCRGLQCLRPATAAFVWKQAILSRFERLAKGATFTALRVKFAAIYG